MNNIMMMLPFLMGMKNGGNMGNMAELMSALSGNAGGASIGQSGAAINPMMSLFMNMMNKNGAKKEETPPQAPPKKPEIDRFAAIRNLSGNEVTEALKILLNN